MMKAARSQGRHDAAPVSPHGQATALIFRLDEYRSFWTPRKIAELHRLFIDEGMSQGLVAKELNCTRNMVVGMCDRQGLKRAKPRVDGRSLIAHEPYVPPHLRPPEPYGARIPFVMVTECKWPVDEVDGQHLFCDEPRLGHRNYCPYHARKAVR